jgi:hypothetical protein
MADITVIVKQIASELSQKSRLSKRRILDVVIDSGIETIRSLERQKESGKPLPPVISEALNKIKTVKVIDGDTIPIYQMEALKELIKKVALRKLKQLEEEQLRKKATHAKTRRQAKQTKN